MKVAAVIVTYNRKELLLENVNMILQQKIDADIIIVDNHSSDGTEEYLKTCLKGLTDRYKYYYLDKNTGGAGGFSFGTKIAYEEGYDWIILMDDDGKPGNDDCFSALFEYIDKNNYKPSDKIMLNSCVTCDGEIFTFGIGHIDTLSALKKTNMINNDGSLDDIINPFNGTLISNGLVREIGFPNEDFFIKGDENDYNLRAKLAKAIIKTIICSDYRHPIADNMKVKRVFGHEMFVFIEQPWKEYYNVRNHVYSILNNGGKKIDAFIYFSKRVYCTLTLPCKKMKTLKHQINGYSDGKRGKLGATILP